MRSVKLDGDAVTLQGRSAGGFEVAAVDGASGGGGGGGGGEFSWWSERHGGMRVKGDDALLDLRFSHGLRLVANISSPRVLWDSSRPNEAGPEGWLSRTGLLPCHYFVHSFGSPTRYALWHGSGQTNGGRGMSDGRRHRRGGSGVGSTTTSSSSSSIGTDARHSGMGRPPRLQGSSALAHVERNWGASFPSGWVWGQATSTDGRTFLVFTGGRFVIGPLTTDSYVIGLRAVGRSGEGGEGGEDRQLNWDFRTTDLDRVREIREPCAGSLSINATSRDGTRRLSLRLSAAPSTFGARIMVPTMTDGFSDEPGCRESHVAKAHVVAWQVDSGRELLRADIPRAVLEFGGGFQCTEG